MPRPIDLSKLDQEAVTAIEALSPGDSGALETARRILDELRAVPSIGWWVILGSYVAEDGEVLPDSIPRPCKPWFATKTEAISEASARTEPSWIAPVERIDGAWTTGTPEGCYQAGHEGAF